MKNLFLFFKRAVLYPAILILVVAPFSPVFAQQDAFKSGIPGICTGKNYGTPAMDARTVPTIQGFECLLTNFLSAAITLLGIVAFVMFLIGGFRYLTAGANAKGTEAGKNSITFAILGIVLALASFLILNILSNVTGVKSILIFNTQYKP